MGILTYRIIDLKNPSINIVFFISNEHAKIVKI